MPLYVPGGVYPGVYTLLYPPGYTVQYVRLPYPGCPVCSVVREEGPGLKEENSLGERGYEAHIALLLPKECDTSAQRNLPLSRG